MRRVVVWVVLVALAPAAWAQTAQDKAAAAALFQDGRRLMKAGDYAAACPKLEVSQRMDPSSGTLLNLGECYEKLGRTASAWVSFRDAAVLAHANGNGPQAKEAARRTALLVPRLAHLTVHVAQPDVAELEVRLDGARLDPALLDTAVAVDPARHAVSVSALGKQEWNQTIEVAPAQSQRMDVVLVDEPAPALAPDAGVAVVAPPDAALPPPQVAPPPPLPPPARVPGGLSWQRKLAIGLGVAGMVGLVVGGGFGLDARGKWHDARSGCSGGTTGCTTDAVRLGGEAGRSADISTASFAIGGACAAGALALWWLTPAHELVAAPAADAHTVGLVVRGGF